MQAAAPTDYPTTIIPSLPLLKAFLSRNSKAYGSTRWFGTMKMLARQIEAGLRELEAGGGVERVESLWVNMKKFMGNIMVPQVRYSVNAVTITALTLGCDVACRLGDFLGKGEGGKVVEGVDVGVRVGGGVRGIVGAVGVDNAAADNAAADNAAADDCDDANDGAAVKDSRDGNDADEVSAGAEDDREKKAKKKKKKKKKRKRDVIDDIFG